MHVQGLIGTYKVSTVGGLIFGTQASVLSYWESSFLRSHLGTYWSEGTGVGTPRVLIVSWHTII